MSVFLSEPEVRVRVLYSHHDPMPPLQSCVIQGVFFFPPLPAISTPSSCLYGLTIVWPAKGRKPILYTERAQFSMSSSTLDAETDGSPFQPN